MNQACVVVADRLIAGEQAGIEIIGSPGVPSCQGGLRANSQGPKSSVGTAATEEAKGRVSVQTGEAAHSTISRHSLHGLRRGQARGSQHRRWREETDRTIQGLQEARACAARQPISSLHGLESLTVVLQRRHCVEDPDHLNMDVVVRHGQVSADEAVRKREPEVRGGHGWLRKAGSWSYASHSPEDVPLPVVYGPAVRAREDGVDADAAGVCRGINRKRDSGLEIADAEVFLQLPRRDGFRGIATLRSGRVMDT